jgi:DUF4097 and DUF4098 domain-containing protein YvlB
MRAITLTLALLAAGAVPAAAQETFHWSGRLAAGKRLEIKGVNGDIHATGGGSEVDVSATKHARRGDIESVEIKVVTTDEGVTICAVYPTPRRARKPNDCTAGDHWSSSTEDNDVTVDFEVRVPAGVKFLGHTVNGEVEAEHLGADVGAYTVNGSVRVSTTGYAEATTVNGSITAEMGRADWPEAVAFRTVNGGITLDLPASFSAEVRAETLNGDVISDFPLTVTGRFGPHRLRGTVGKGGHELSLSTVNGNIRLRKGT